MFFVKFVVVFGFYFLVLMRALTSMSEMFFGRFTHRSGVGRLSKILVVSGSIRACSVSVRTFFNSCLIPLVLGVRVILNTMGVLFCCCCVLLFWLFRLWVALRRSSNRLGVVKCC